MGVKAYLELMRPLNGVMGAFAVLIGAFITRGFGIFYPPLVYKIGVACAVAFVYTGGGNALNDYFDRQVDEKNHPSRPIPSGRIKPKNALIFASVLLAASILLTLPLTLISYAIIIAAVVLIVMYEMGLKAKGLVGNVTISAITSFSFLFGGAVFNTLRYVFLFALLAFLSSIGREVIKDIEDMEGDMGARMTLPMSIGVKHAGWVAVGAIIAAVIISPLPIFIALYDGTRAMIYLGLVLVCDAVFLYSTSQALRGMYHAPYPPSMTTKVAMIFGLLAFVVPAAL